MNEYISALSSLWKKMTDKEKEPYVKLSENIRKNLIKNIPQANKNFKILNKKRKKRTPRIDKNERDENRAMNQQKQNNEIEKKEPNKNDFSTTVYTTNKYYKKKAIENNIYCNKNKDEISISLSNSKGKDISIDINENEESNSYKYNKNENNDLKTMKINDKSLNKFNEYLNLTLIPFVVQTFNFLEKISNKNISN